MKHLTTVYVLGVFLYASIAYAKLTKSTYSSISSVVTEYTNLLFAITGGVAAAFGIKHAWTFFRGNEAAKEKMINWGVGLFFVLIIFIVLKQLKIEG